MVKYNILWSEAALDDLKDIYDYLQGETGKDTAKRLVMDIRKSTRFLVDYPRMYQVFSGSIDNARHIVVHNWRVLYVVDDAKHQCNILAVVHTRRQI